MTTDEAKTIVSLATAVIECTQADTDYSLLKLEDRLADLIETLLNSTDGRRQWAGLMVVERSIQPAVRSAQRRNMAGSFVDGVLSRIQLASI